MAERADAVRNRRAILAATEELLAGHRPDQVSMEQVAVAAGVGKGTVFHRFGSRMGLMIALMQERAFALNEAVDVGPPPLGPGAPPRERLLAFLTAVVELIARNKGLLVALGQAATTNHHQDEDLDAHPVYRAWHAHVSGLLRAERPDLDTETIAHVLLGSVHAPPILAHVADDGGARLADALRLLTSSVLESPAADGRSL